MLMEPLDLPFFSQLPNPYFFSIRTGVFGCLNSGQKTSFF